jgi:hypothetical protein
MICAVCQNYNYEVEESVMGLACSMNGENKVYRLLIRKAEGKRPLAKPRR